MKIKKIAIATIATLAAAVVTFATTAKHNQSIWDFEAEAMDAQVDGGLRTNDTIHQIWDSGLFPHGNAVNTFIFWLDDSTLLFMADKDPKPAVRQASTRIPWLFLWHLGEKPHPVSDDPQEATRFYRAARGIVCFWQKKFDPTTDKTSEVLMKGPPAEEREAPPWDIRQKGLPLNGIPGNIEPIDCEQFVDPSMSGRVFTADSYRHFYLDRAADPPGLPPAVGENPVLTKADGTERKVLPIPPEEVGYIYFRTFDNVFWILEEPIGSALRGGPTVEGFSRWQATNCLAIWRVNPDSGSAERSCIPFEPWSGHVFDASHHTTAIISLVPTARGLFFTSYDLLDGTEEHVGPSGLYKLESSSAERIVAGYMLYPSVSPDGCRVAFVYGPNRAAITYGMPGTWTIAAIDLCSSNSKQ